LEVFYTLSDIERSIDDDYWSFSVSWLSDDGDMMVAGQPAELRQGTTGAAVTGWVRPSGELVALPWYVETLVEADGVLAIVAQTLEPEEQQLVLVELKTAQWQVLERGVSD